MASSRGNRSLPRGGGLVDKVKKKGSIVGSTAGTILLSDSESKVGSSWESTVKWCVDLPVEPTIQSVHGTHCA
eukprot:5040362-Lingulodinium_polyedra.AAC.1